MAGAIGPIETAANMRSVADSLGRGLSASSEAVVSHVYFTHPAALASGIDEAPQRLAAFLRAFNVPHDQLTETGGLVARKDTDGANACRLVEQAEIHAHVLDAVKLDFVDRLEHDAPPHDQPVRGDLVLGGHVFSPFQEHDQTGERGQQERPGAPIPPFSYHQRSEE